MTWSYSCDPSSSDKDAVRLLIGDTDESDQLLKDEEIVYLISVGGSAEYGAVLAAESVSAKLSRLADVKVGELSKSASQQSQAYRRLAEDLRKRFYALGGVMPIFGGISRSKEQSLDLDDDLIGSPFVDEQFDIPGGPDFQRGRNGRNPPGRC